MSYRVQIELGFRARQGLPSPARTGAGLPTLDVGDGRPFMLRAGLVFDDAAIENSAGRALDSDVALLVLQDATRRISAEPWTALFTFRPSLERVARHLYETLLASLGGLAYVEIEDSTAGFTVRYQPS